MDGPAARVPSVFEAPLTGINLIEASAGTGKTWTIAGLYLRLALEAERRMNYSTQADAVGGVSCFSEAAWATSPHPASSWLVRA